MVPFMCLGSILLGRRSDYWDREFADSVNFIGDPVVATPDVLETAVQPDDEFLILATDGLWCAGPFVLLMCQMCWSEFSKKQEILPPSSPSPSASNFPSSSQTPPPCSLSLCPSLSLSVILAA
jgi:hypothetical protein